MAERWYKNSRGEWFVICQFALFGLIAIGPRTLSGSGQFAPVWVLLGLILFGSGAAFALAGMLKLGRRNFSPFVRPKAGGVLLDQGVYRLVRHPVYSGLLQMALGWALWVSGWLTIGYVLLLFILFDAKARREERWLEEKFPGYVGYRQKVRKFIPFLY